MINDIIYDNERRSLPTELSESELYRNFQLLKSGNLEARNVIIEHNLRLVMFIFNKHFRNTKYIHVTSDSDDLFEMGVIGLIKAIDSYDTDKGIKFATYASRCINNEYLMFLRKTNKLFKEQSLEMQITVDEELHSIETIASDEDLADDYESKETRLVVRNSLAILNDLEREVISLHYGFNDEELLTLSEIGKLLGFSQSYLSRVERQAKLKLKRYLIQKEIGINKKALSEYDYIKELDAKDKIVAYAKIIIEKGLTIRELSRKINMDPGGLGKLIGKNLPNIDMKLYEDYKVAIEKRKLNDKKIKDQKSKEKSEKRFKDFSDCQKKNTNKIGPKQAKTLIFKLFPDYSNEEILKALSNLTDEDRKIILLRYPMENGIQQTYKNIQYRIKRILLEMNNYLKEQNKSLGNNKINLLNADQMNYINELINRLNDSSERVVLLLRLGFVDGKVFNEQQIASFLEKKESEVCRIVQSGLRHIVELSTLTIEDLDNISEQLLLINKPKGN